MRIALWVLALILVTTSPAFACKCTPDTSGDAAKAVLSDPSISVVDAFVRATNPRTRITVMDIKKLHSGGLASSYVRAKYGASSCDAQPMPGNQILLIKNEPDGTYSLVGDCARSAVIQYLKGQ